MLTSMRIRNFRCFEDLSLDLSRINIISGQNNAGKTTLLEAAFLHLGPTNPRLSILINAMRGYRDTFDDPLHTWGWLFFHKDVSREISIQSKDDMGANRELKLTLFAKQKSTVDRQDVARLGDGDTKTFIVSSTLKDLILQSRYIDSEGQEVGSSAGLTSEGVKFDAPGDGVFPSSIFFIPSLTTHGEDTDRYSKLEAEEREQPVLDALKILDKRVRKLMVSTGQGTKYMLCDLGSGLRMPLSMTGAGMNIVFSIVVSLLSCPGGLLLVDEIDTGLHYSILQSVWNALVELAEQANVQILATTHSYECIRAAQAVISGRISCDARFVRLESNAAGITAVALDTSMLETAISGGWEIR